MIDLRLAVSQVGDKTNMGLQTGTCVVLNLPNLNFLKKALMKKK